MVVVTAVTAGEAGGVVLPRAAEAGAARAEPALVAGDVLLLSSYEGRMRSPFVVLSRLAIGLT